MKTIYDVIVIGGGLAGAASAIQLARGGRQVLLIEKEKSAHHKVCGEFLSFEAQYYLRNLNIDLTALGSVEIKNVQIARGDKIVTASLPFKALSLSRFCLDEAILQQAMNADVMIERGVSAGRLSREQNCWRVDLSNSKTINAKNIILATGKHDLRQQPRAKGVHNNLIGFKMHFAGACDAIKNNVLILLFNGGYAGVEQIEGGKFNLCLVVSKQRFAQLDKNWNVLFNNLVQQPSLSFLKNAVPYMDKPLAIYGIPYGFVHHAQDEAGLYRVGDQMAVIPSFLGNGMSIALHTGFVAAKAIIDGIDNNHYHANAARQLSIKVKSASYLSRALVKPAAQKIAFDLCRLMPQLATWTAARSRLQLN